MNEEKTRRSKTNRNNDIGVCAKSVKSPIVLLQRIHIGANGAILAKDIVTDKLNITVSINQGQAVQVTATPIKKTESKTSSNTILSNVENGESMLQCVNPIETTTVLQSTLTDLDQQVALSTTKSYKFKKKLKRLQKIQLPNSLKTQSGDKFNHKNSLILNKKLSEKMRKDQKLLADKTTIQTTVISTAVATRRKISTRNSNFEKKNLISDSVQEHVSAPEKPCGSSDILCDTSKTEETIQINKLTSTRSGLIRKIELNVQNSLQNISTSLTSQEITNTLSPLEHPLNKVDNSTKNTISTRNKSRVKASNASTSNACPNEMSNKCINTEPSEKVLSVNESTDANVNNDSSNLIKTRSKVHEKKPEKSEKPVLKSTPKRLSNRSSLNNKIELDNTITETNSANIENNSNIKTSLSTRSKLSNVKKSDDQATSMPLSATKTEDNLELNSLDINIAKETSVKSTVPTRSKLLKKKKIDNENKLKTRPSVIGNKSADLIKDNSTSNSPLTIPEKVIEKSKVTTDVLTIKENKIVKNKISTRSKLLEKKKTDGESETVGNKVTQTEENSASRSPEIQFDNESSINGNVLPFEKSISLVDVNKTEETVKEEKRISTRSKTLNKKNAADSEKNVENNPLQSEKAQTVVPPVSAAGKKSLSSRKSSDKLKVVDQSLKTPDNDAKTIISTRSRLREKTKIDDNKKLVLEKSSIHTITGGSNQNESVSTPTEVESSKPYSNKTSKKVDTTTIKSTRSKVKKGKTDNNEKSGENKKSLEQIHSTSDSPTQKNNEQPLPNDTEKNSLKLLTDTPNTKESTLTRSKILEKKKKTVREKSDVENQIAPAENSQLTSKQTDVQMNNESSLINSTMDSQECLTDSTKIIENVDMENIISTRSNKTLEKDKIDDHENRNVWSTDPTRIPKKIDFKDSLLARSNLHKETYNREESIVENVAVNAEQNSQLTSKQTDIQMNSESSLISSTMDSQECSTDSTKIIENVDMENTISTRSNKTLEKDKIDDHENRNFWSTDPTRIPKKIDFKGSLLARSKLHRETYNREESIVENVAVHAEQNNFVLNSSPAHSSNVSTDTINLQPLPHTVTVNVDDSTNTITTRSGLTKKRSDAKPLSKKKKAVAKNQHSPSKSQTDNESTAQQTTNVNLENETNNCNIEKQQQVCSKKEIVIKLSRCDQDQPIHNCPAEKETPKKKVLKGKRKADIESTVDDVPKAKKTKQVDSSDNNAELSVSTENQQLAVDSQIPLNATENIDESVVESKSNADSNHSDISNIRSIGNVSENLEATEKNVCLEDISNIITADNKKCVTENPEILEQENQCDNERVEHEKEIIVNSSGDNNSVHEVEMLEDRDEGISLDTSENEANVEINVNNDDVIVEDNASTIVIQDKEHHSLLARKMVEEVINDWTDDDKTDNVDNAGVNEDFSAPEVIQIDDNDDLDLIVDVHQAAVSTEKEKDPSHNLIPTPRKNVEPDSIDISDSSPIGTETSASATGNKECNNKNKEPRESNSTSEVSEAEDVDDSNFESIDENSCTEIFADENCNEQEDNVPQETITYYNSEDISMDLGTPANSNTLNDVVMNLKDACDKITADLSAVNTSYENNEETPNHHEPELLYISDDSNEIEAEEEEEVMIIEPHVEIHETQPSPVENRRLMISNQLQQVMQQGSPSISVIKASELRDEILEPPVEYPIKQSGQQVVVYPQRQMLSTTLLPASIISGKSQNSSPLFTEDTIIQCPKCRCEFVGKSRLRRHWLTCGDAMYLYCPFCTTKVKQRRSLVHHLNTQHQDQITKAEVIKMVDQIVKQTREAAGGKQQGSCSALQELIESSPTPAVPIIELPAYIRIQCVVCNKVYDEVPATYKKICDDCSSDLMTAICQLCRKQYMLSNKIAVHVQGNCIFSGRIKCRECEFVSSSKYNLQEHIIRKHIYVAPEDYFICRYSCGKTFRIQDALKKHERICIKEPNLSCKFCEFKTKHRSAMKMHVQQHIVHEKLSINNDGTVQLFGQSNRSGTDDDDRDLTTEQQVRSVIRVHCSRCNRTIRLTSNRSSCEFCKLSFTFSCSRCPDTVRLDSLHSVRLHVIRSHCVKIHECPHCTERFAYVYDLTKHASKCKAKSFKCEQCNYCASEYYKIRQHKRRVHMNNTSEPPFCKKCGKWFNRGDSLKRHEKLHCGVEPKLSCEHCQFKTKTKFSLLRHIQSQHAYIYENFSFVCDRCNKFYTNMFSYEEHVKNCHALIRTES